ncbi:tail fiber protein [Ralstonia phage RSJ2]|uniref:Putative phage-related tail fiber protein n=1 Tax=Ralstonia phage RSJ2 TaxID=1481785 RepID=A0A068Q5X6_9CAUD|nr:tail fiber protein [Ralstonia phage RSJ2]BAP15843.1 putative phage-related tail fiber protein [Ralstonia phage RSJ2]
MADVTITPWIDAGDPDGLKYSMNRFQCNGTANVFSINFAGAAPGYLDRAHLKYYVINGADGTYVTPITPVPSGAFQSSTLIKLEQTPGVPYPLGLWVVIFRDTPKSVPLVDFTDGAVINEENLDLMAEQSIYVAAEMTDRFEEVIGSNQEVIDRAAEALATANEALDASAATTIVANDAAAQAAAADGKADTAVSTANTAKATAEGIDAKAQSALDASAAATATANAANATAANALDVAQDALDQVQASAMPTTGGTFTGPVYGITPTAGDSSTKLATTAFVTSAISTALVGQIVFEARTSARAGYLKLNGALLNRADYPALWAYANASGAVVSEGVWSAGSQGCFSSGDGTTTFRVPDLRGEFVRGWDDARGVDGSRGIGTWQASANLSHNHTASTDVQGSHNHSAWTDGQGWHGHGVSDPGHSHFGGLQTFAGGGQGASGSPNFVNQRWVDGSGTGIGINGDGTHGHNVGIGYAGDHGHNITVNANGASEARPRNVALLALIRYL